MATLNDPNLPEAIPEFTVLEETRPVLTAQLKDIDGTTDLPLASIATLELTLFIPNTGTIVNSLSDTGIIPPAFANITVSASGLITWTLLEADTEVLEALAGCGETHRALFYFVKTPATGGESGRKRVDLDIVNLQTVT